MRPSHSSSIQTPESTEHYDPYRCRRPSEASNRKWIQPQHIQVSSDISAAATLTMEEPAGRTHSYLPYTNHPLDIEKTEQQQKCMMMDDGPAKSLTRSLPPFMNTSSQNLGSFITEPARTLLDEMAVTGFHTVSARASGGRFQNGNSAASLTDFRRYTSRRRTSRRIIILIAFAAVIIIAAIVTFFCWPRTPQIRLAAQGAGARSRHPDDATDWGPDQQHPYLRTSWLINVTLDNHENFITTHVSRLDLVLSDQDTLKPFARASAENLVLLPRQEKLLNLVFDVEYETPSLKDPTFEHLYNACGPQKISATAPPALNITLQAIFDIPGIAWKPTVIMDSPLANGFQCPNN
ncbi:hypothetical protein BX666DRAFT_1981132 [Dichotomocladium elegans]|nr:hypothetical protein BX666DRAFT_1981132 [Dichotomocladium elegans]